MWFNRNFNQSMMNCVYVIPLLMLLLDQNTTYGDEICQEAIDNIHIVLSCPTSKQDRDRAARRMKCNKFAKLKNCTNDKLEYHCVINAFMNETLEVCAPVRFIFGYCTEFNIAGRVLQMHREAKCNNVFPKCDDRYQSNDAYKYPDCYTLVYKATQKTTVLPPVNKTYKANEKTEHADEKKEGIIYPAIAAIFVLVIILGLTVVLRITVAVWKVNRKRNSTMEQDELNSRQGSHPKPNVVYLYFKSKCFKRFNEIYNETMDCIHRFENKQTKQRLSMGVMVKIGVVGNFTDDNLKVFPKGKRNLSEEAHTHIWKAVPLLCFQNNLSPNSALKTLRTESACHKILIQSKQAICNETDEACGSTIIILQNKESIIKTITSCLIQPICQLEKKWLKYLEAEHSITLTPANLENLQLIVRKFATET